MKYQKRLSAPKHYPIKRKEYKYVDSGKGAHKTSNSIPLVVILRDLLGVVDNKKGAKKVLQKGRVLIDGKKVKDPSLRAGFMDTISIPDSDKYYRLVMAKKGLKLVEIPEKDSEKKLCKIKDKKILKGGKIQLSLHDGNNIISEDDYPTQGTLVLSVPDKEIDSHIEFKKGHMALISQGKHAGQIAKIKKVRERQGSQPDLVALENEGEFETLKSYVFLVGKNSPEVTLDAEN